MKSLQAHLPPSQHRQTIEFIVTDVGKNPYGVGMNKGRNGRHSMYGNPQGLPGLPQSRYMPLGSQIPRPPPRPPAPRPPPPQPPMMSNLPPQPSIPQPDPMVGRRIDMLEQRLNATEQSNRTLLDELMRLQQELKMNVKKNEMGLVEEKEGRSRLDAAFRQSQNKTYEMEDRIRRCEDGIKETRNAIQQMTSHTKSIEMALKSAEQEQMERRGNSAQRLQEYRHEVMKMNQSKEQLERLVYSMRDDVREATTRVEGLTQELGSLESNVKMQARLMEESNSRRNTPQLALPKTPVEDSGKMTEGVRLALEGKMIQMNTLIQDLTQRINMEAKKREKVETDVNIRINELLEDYGSTKVEKDQEMREFDDKMKELQAGFSASEKQRILMEISSVAQDLNTKIDQKEAKLRDDTVNKLTVIEKTLTEENRRRAAKEKQLQESVDKQMKEAQMRENDGTAALKKHMEQHETQVRNKLGEMTTTINALEADVKQYQLEQEKVMAAEITQRQNDKNVLEGKIDDLEDRQRRGLASLQSAVGDVAAKKNAGSKSPDYDEIQRLQSENADGIREQVAKDVARIEGRLGTVETKVQQQEQRMDNKLQSLLLFKLTLPLPVPLASQDTPKNVTNLKEEMEDMEQRLSKKVDQERKERMDDVSELRADIDKIVGKNESVGTVPSLARLNQDVDETQTGMKKLAEAVHVVKSFLSDKIKDEKKTRVQEDTLLKRDVERLNTKYSELSDKIRSSA
ncbi:LOW QUALITY PROTEIN: cingulin-like [Penaeus monodon]|uniref:LOW QUALITY PROTEIN: cingulin-like n=1 Tax=Penaeus monodon TaxID=6687 RepID=UPI0018A77379|nr:LOW QUALITY PROTEIN: cingulin-like [Penaeus monodon]